MSEGISAVGAGGAPNSPIFGASANVMRQKLEELHVQKESEGGWKPACILNMNPFPLRVENGHIMYMVAACPADKDFAVCEVTTPRIFTQYRATREDNTGGKERDYDIHDIPPVYQALEFYGVYQLGSDVARASGGVVIFEGGRELLEKGVGVKVRVPRIVMKGRIRSVAYTERLLKDLLDEGREGMRLKALEMIDLGKRYADSDTQKNYLTDEHREYARLAKRHGWITQLPTFVAESTTRANLCDKCGAEYVSTTGVCKCGYVKFPLLAYEKGEIEFSHVRMDTLNAEEWKKAKATKAKREEARR